MDDFKWLEDGRRKVEGWGKEIEKGKYGVGVNGVVGETNRNGPPGRGRGRGGAHGGRYPAQQHRETKIETLQRELASRGVTMQILPDGMEKRKQNQSGIDAKWVDLQPSK